MAGVRNTTMDHALFLEKAVFFLIIGCQYFCLSTHTTS